MWSPGKNLPIQHDDYTSDAHCLKDLLQVMESKLESGFQELNGRLEFLEARMFAIKRKLRQISGVQVCLPHHLVVHR